jgi:hypothetical protein
MNWFLFLIAVLIISTFTDYFNKSISKLFWYISLSIMTLIAGFRNMGGKDFLIYKNHYYGNEEAEFEYGYEILVKLFRFFGLSYEWFVFIVSISCLIIIANFIKKYSPKPNFSLFLYTGGFYIYYNLIATRQLIALSFFLFGINYLINRKDLKFIITVVAASFFHASAIVLLFGMIWTRFFRLSVLVAFVFIAILFSVSFDLSYIITLLSKFGFSFIETRMVYDYLLPDRVFPLTTFLRVIFTYGVILGYQLKVGFDDDKLKIFFGFYTIFFILFLVFNRYDIMMRIWVYFEIVSIILIPSVVSLYRNQVLKLTFLLFYLTFYTLSFFNNILSFDGGDLAKFNLIFLS